MEMSCFPKKKNVLFYWQKIINIQLQNKQYAVLITHLFANIASSPHLYLTLVKCLVKEDNMNHHH